jgi:hypothetical protein
MITLSFDAVAGSVPATVIAQEMSCDPDSIVSTYQAELESGL